MPGDERQLHAGELLGDGARLLGIAGIVAHFKLELLAEHAGAGVGVGHELLGAILHLPAEGGFPARHRPGHRDGDVLGGSRARTGESGERRADHPGVKDAAFHTFLPETGTGAPPATDDESRSLPVIMAGIGALSRF
jgi:hypothetical protein